MKRTAVGLVVAAMMTFGLVSAKASFISGFGGGTVVSDAAFTVSGSTAFDSFGNSGQFYSMAFSSIEDGPVTISSFCYGTGCSLLSGTISGTALETGVVTTFDGTFTAVAGSLAGSFPVGSSATFAFKDPHGTDIFSSGTVTGLGSVPEPGSLLLLGSGLLSLAGFARRRLGVSR